LHIPLGEIEYGLTIMSAQEKINELIAFVADLTDVDQRRACLAQLDQLLLEERPAPREARSLSLAESIGIDPATAGRPA
jgi:hypothetical protein